MTDHYSYPDFLEFCTASNARLRADDEIIWSNRIPVPSVLVKKIFFSAQLYLEAYISHLLSATVVSLADLKNSTDLLSKLPSRSAFEENGSALELAFSEAKNLKPYVEFENSVIELSGLSSYAFNLDSYRDCLRHDGKKYERLDYPESVQDQLALLLPKVLTKLRRANGDMIGNVIADMLNIYRAGFTDAFAAIFKRFLEFKFDKFPGVDPLSAHLGQVQTITVNNVGEISPAEDLRGCLWEPNLQQGGLIGVDIDVNHPFNMLSDEERWIFLLLALSDEEMHVYNEDHKQFLESFRYRVSAKLRLLWGNQA